MGGDEYVDVDGRVWMEDSYFTLGITYSNTDNNILATQDDWIYQSERYGEFTYEIPLPDGNYEIVFHLSELYFTAANERKFDIQVEGTTAFTNVDIVALGQGVNFKALTLEKPQLVTDGALSLSFLLSSPVPVNYPKLSGIEIKLVEDHLAHAVANGPYIATDMDKDGFEVVAVDGGLSHTHAIDAYLVDFVWKTGATILGTTEVADLTLPVGENTVTLTVTDSDGNDSTETTTITVRPDIYPTIVGLTPSSGSIAGGNIVTISGSGFTASAAETTVAFGDIDLTDADIEIVDEKTITVQAPSAAIGAPVSVSVTTVVGTSNADLYTYIASSEIKFTESVLTDFPKPTRVAFGPDGRLYVSDLNGQISKFDVDDDLNLSNKVTSQVSPWRPILGSKFDNKTRFLLAKWLHTESIQAN